MLEIEKTKHEHIYNAQIMNRHYFKLGLYLSLFAVSIVLFAVVYLHSPGNYFVILSGVLTSLLGMATLEASSLFSKYDLICNDLMRKIDGLLLGESVEQ